MEFTNYKYEDIIVKKNEEDKIEITLTMDQFEIIKQYLEKQYKHLDSSLRSQRKRRPYKGNSYECKKTRYNFLLEEN